MSTFAYWESSVHTWHTARSTSSGRGSMVSQGTSVAGAQRRWIASS